MFFAVFHLVGFSSISHPLASRAFLKSNLSEQIVFSRDPPEYVAICVHGVSPWKDYQSRKTRNRPFSGNSRNFPSFRKCTLCVFVKFTFSFHFHEKTGFFDFNKNKYFYHVFRVCFLQVGRKIKF